jgi:glycerol-3-phosphate dehydrogenase
LIRDLPRLASGDFDVLVVGGGIYGLAAAYDAAQRGLSVALVERSDLGSATSFNHLKTIHGGLRYLQSADLARMRESIRERRAIARIAPRFVCPLPFLMPASASLTRNPLALRMALALDACIGSDRNDGLGAAHRLPAGRLVSPAEARALLEGVAPANFGSAAMWYDYQTVRGDRLTLAFAMAAANHGAVLANYTEAVALLRNGTTRARGVRAKDALTGNEFDISARSVVNAGGPWASAFLRQAALPAKWPLLKAMNLVTSRPAPKAALVAATREGRALVLLPWQGRVLVGTSESRDECAADDQQARRSEMTAFLAEVNETFPALHLEAEEITLVHRGAVPATNSGGRLALLGRSRIIDHGPEGIDNLVSVIGVKYTTARIVAERTVNLLFSKLGRPAVPCRTAEAALPGGGSSDRDPTDPVLHAVREEMAQTLVDVVVRRTGIGAAQYPGAAIARECAEVMQKEMGWSEDRKQRELDALERFYEIIW